METHELSALEHDEALLAYYKQMYWFLHPNEHPFFTLGKGRMKVLQRNLKQQLRFLQDLSEHQWGQGVVEIQTTCSAFMMQESTTVEKRMEVSNQVSELLAFLFHVAENRSQLKYLYAVVNDHYKTLGRLIERYGEKVA